jgi:hypothetical protein
VKKHKHAKRTNKQEEIRTKGSSKVKNILSVRHEEHGTHVVIKRTTNSTLKNINTGERDKIVNPADNDDVIVRKREKQERRISTVDFQEKLEKEEFIGIETLVVACELLPDRNFISK